MTSHETPSSHPSPLMIADTPQPMEAVVFDLGGVLVDWNPRYLYRKLFRLEADMEDFLARVCTMDWNLEQDRGRPWAEAVAMLQARFPEHAQAIAAYHQRWPEMLRGELTEVVAILAELRQTSVRLLALTNWSAETFPVARQRFGFLQWFEGILVSGEEGVIKPDAAIFRLLMQRYQLTPARTAFIDDALPNVKAAAALGFQGIHFTDAPALRTALQKLGLLTSPHRGVEQGPG